MPKISSGSWLMPAAALSNLTAVASWEAGLMALGGLCCVLVFRLLVGRQRHLTMVALTTRSPAGTVIVHEERPEGWTMRIGVAPSSSASTTGSLVDPAAR